MNYRRLIEFNSYWNIVAIEAANVAKHAVEFERFYSIFEFWIMNFDVSKALNWSSRWSLVQDRETESKYIYTMI